jgi:MFS family permease
MGLLLLVVTAGSVAVMPLMGRLVERYGDVRVIRVCATLAWAALVVGALCASRGWAAAIALPFFLQGAGLGSWDVAMNLAGTRVEQALGRSIMPQFHAAFSLATLLGAGIGWAFAHSGAPLLAHISLVAVAGLIIVQVFAGWLLPTPSTRRIETTNNGLTSSDALNDASPSAITVPSGDVSKPNQTPATRSAWLEPRTLLIGVVMLSVSLTEGSANDWITSAVVQSFATTEAVGIACLGVFLAAMTAMRLLGTRLIDRWGRVPTLHLCAVCAIAGLAAFGLGPWLWLAMLGAAIWGLGAALGFPVGISAASDDPLRAARRTAVVSTMGYLAFLGGPPLLGLLADHIGFRPALLVILIPAVLSLLLAHWLAPLKQDAQTSADN